MNCNVEFEMETDKIINLFKDLEVLIKSECYKVGIETNEKEIIARRKNIYDVYDIFKNYFLNHKRIGCLYITENGKKNEKIFGMITHGIF